MKIYPIVAILSLIALAPAFASAEVLDPYPINGNDNRAVFNAAAQYTNAVVSTLPVYQEPYSTSNFMPPVFVQPVNQANSVNPLAVPYQATLVGPGVTNPSYSANYPQAQYPGTVAAQTFAGAGVNVRTAHPAGVVALPSQIQAGTQSLNGWLANLPQPALLPATVAQGSPILQNSRIVGLDNSYSISYANGLPSFYGPAATGGIYTVYGGQTYNTSGTVNYGSNSSNSSYNNSNNSLRNYSGNANTGARSGEWVQTSGGWQRTGQQSVSGHIPW